MEGGIDILKKKKIPSDPDPGLEKNVLNPGQSNLSIAICTKASGVAEKEEEQSLEKLVSVIDIRVSVMIF